ncbi:MAG: immunogenic protein [Bacillota bacterium]|nr:immunogenic protein [Bacillota bacterium]
MKPCRMKYLLLIVFALSLLGIFLLAGCVRQPSVGDNINGNVKTYAQMDDGIWVGDGNSYQQRLEFMGRLENTEYNFDFIYVSNLGEISFDEAWRASGLSSDLLDYFPLNDTILVDWSSE